jgi:hypothetical protein
MELSPRVTPGASVTRSKTGWRLEIPAGNSSSYRLAQLDDYAALHRHDFLWINPASLSLRARVSNKLIPGTWGFGLWNDPFSFFTGLGGMTRPFPVLPNAAWFFFASPENFLSFREDKPPNGFLAATFRSPHLPALLLSPAIFLLPMLFFHPATKWVRSKLRRLILEDSVAIEIDVTEWHDYHLRWKGDKVSFEVDGLPIFETSQPPKGPLGFVIWIDNQYAAFTPAGKISAGTLENPVPAWIEIENLFTGQVEKSRTNAS